MDDPTHIHLRGVRQNNLQGFDLDLPLGRMIAVTGLSGAGKSSLVFETLHAEGQRRYVETFSPYTRQFLELLDRPNVDDVENIRPSIAVQQGNTVKTSRSTVGTITELCDYFKVWFSHVARLHDPATGEILRDDNPQSIWPDLLDARPGESVIVGFEIERPKKLKPSEILDSLSAQGFARAVLDGEVTRLAEVRAKDLRGARSFVVAQDRVRLDPSQRSRFIEAAQSAFCFGRGRIRILDTNGAPLRDFTEGLHSPATGESFRPAIPALFSFNSPVGACPECRGFGRIIEIDDSLIVPDHSLSVDEGAIKPFQGEVYGESLRDLQRAARQRGVRTDAPWSELTAEEIAFVMEGDKEGRTGWYGVRGFFDYLHEKIYRMHVRVFLAKYRSYNPCPSCEGARLRPEALNWKWRGEYTLPQLYALPVGRLLPMLREAMTTDGDDRELAAATEGILTRLHFLDQVGLGYLTLDRPSRTLSGGETMRVNLTSCLGSSLVDTLFVLDEPSVGLHARDIDRLGRILRHLSDQGNTVVVVEHDESLIQSADHVIEIGPAPGEHGGQVVFSGSPDELRSADTHTGRYLSGRDDVPAPAERRPVDLRARRQDRRTPRLSLYGVRCHNLDGIDAHIPLRRLVCLSGVSGSGKSTLLDNGIHQTLRDQRGAKNAAPAAVADWDGDLPVNECLLVDQSPVSKTPRSNPALFSEAWEPIRKLFASTDDARTASMGPGHFSFNSGDGRCPECSGLGYERVEMQFVSDLFVPCQACEGKRFKPEVLAVRWRGHSISEILDLHVSEAVEVFADQPKIRARLDPLAEVGLGYLTLGQPLNTLSGGESQRLKLVRCLGKFSRAAEHALIMVDEPTTGLHRDDIKRLVAVLQRLVEQGRSVIVIEHNLDVLKAADWLIEMGPEAGTEGGRIVAQGPPETVAESDCPSAPYLRATLASSAGGDAFDWRLPAAAEASAAYANAPGKPDGVEVEGAREHNLRDISTRFPRQAISVVTGVSGSGKSSLAFDIVFAEGQRRFMESMSAYARQFVEQMPRPDIDAIRGIAPTIAIEQRVTRGTRKSTVATITEVAQYLRLLYARIGVQHSPTTGAPVTTQSANALLTRLRNIVREVRAPHYYLAAPLIRGRKGHHQPVADWARDHGYTLLRVDGELTPIDAFRRLDRYREHDVDLVAADLGTRAAYPENRDKRLKERLDDALERGKGTACLLRADGAIDAWLSTLRTDPVSGEAFPELDPKHFSWNSARGWCPTCHGHGILPEWLEEDDDGTLVAVDPDEAGGVCPDCGGARLNAVSRAVKLPIKRRDPVSLPELLQLTPNALLETLRRAKTDKRSRPILEELMPEIEERLRFMGRVGLDYLSLDRASATLSGGEAQRIRLAAQLGSNLAGVLYVLDEPSIGLHARDNAKLIDSLENLRDRGNTLIVVEHDDATMARADHILDLGPGAGIHGGHIMAEGSYRDILGREDSLTGRYLRSGIAHPQRGAYRPLPRAWDPRRKDADAWLALRGASLRNLKGFDLRLPKNRLNVLCGVSGAGKSSLARDLLLPVVRTAARTGRRKLTAEDARNAGACRGALAFSKRAEAPFRDLYHGDGIRKVIEVDQAPIGKTPRSTPATYIGAFDLIRSIFAQLPEARFRGHDAGTFSFNTKGGRCEACKGAGRIKLEMNFMPDTYVTCEECGGRRYGAELEDLRWNGKNIADVLAMSFEEAAAFFDFHAQLHSLLNLMVETGLGYITLGQNSPTLSGGEAQRLKLVSELARGLPSFKERSRGRGHGNLYILEEPTIGLHLSDCERLIELLHRLVDDGHTVLVIEHHLDIVADADYVVEIGPDGGQAGGQLLYQGDVAGLRQSKESVTARFLG